MRSISMALAFCLCVLAGVRGSKKLYARCAGLTELRAALRTLRTEIAFFGAPLPEAVSRVGAKGAFGAFARALVETGEPRSAWRAAEGALLAGEGEKQALRRFFDSLGKGDMAAVQREFERVDQALTAAIDEAEKRAKSGGRLRSTLGVLTGVAAVILMI